MFLRLFDIVFSLSLLKSGLLLTIGSFSFRSWSLSLMFSCNISERFGEKNLYWCLLFLHFWRFLRGMKLVFVDVISVTSDVFSSVAEWFWMSHLVFMSIMNHNGDGIFGFNFTWSFRGFISTLLSFQFADVSQYFNFLWIMYIWSSTKDFKAIISARKFSKIVVTSSGAFLSEICDLERFGGLI